MSDILVGTTVLRIDISIWTGRAKLNRGEVDDSQLPPEDLVTLGSKRLFDPAKLTKFNSIKSNVNYTCNRYGVKFLGGWLVAASVLPTVLQRLEELRRDWDTTMAEFLANYSDECEAWLSQNEEWRTILASALPVQSEISRRFNFGWQTFNVAPAPTHGIGDQTDDEIQAVRPRAMEKMAKAIADTLPVYADGKKFRSAPLQRLADQCNALSFASPELSKLATVLQELTGHTRSVEIVSLVLGKLADAAAIEELCQPVEAPEDILDGIITKAAAPSEFVDVPPVAGVAPESVQPRIDTPPVVDALQQAKAYLDTLPPVAVPESSSAPASVVEPVATPVVSATANKVAVNNMMGMLDRGGLW